MSEVTLTQQTVAVLEAVNLADCSNEQQSEQRYLEIVNALYEHAMSRDCYYVLASVLFSTLDKLNTICYRSNEERDVRRQLAYLDSMDSLRRSGELFDEEF